MSARSKKPNGFVIFLIVVLILVGGVWLNFFIRAHSFYSPTLIDTLHPTLK